jgi:hypothetical protein
MWRYSGTSFDVCFSFFCLFEMYISRFCYLMQGSTFGGTDLGEIMCGQESFSLVSADAFGASGTYQPTKSCAYCMHMSKVLSSVVFLPDVPVTLSCHVIIGAVLSVFYHISRSTHHGVDLLGVLHPHQILTLLVEQHMIGLDQLARSRLWIGAESDCRFDFLSSFFCQREDLQQPGL